MRSKIKGNIGEALATKFLERKGYEIIERNHRIGRAEIDIIALLNNELLVFVEVKMRSRSDYGEAESFVSENQQAKIQEAAEQYIQDINWVKDVRFDIITVAADESLQHFEDAFY